MNKNWKFAGGVEVHASNVKALFESRGHRVIPFSVNEADNWPSETSEYFVSPVNMRSDNPREKARAVGRALFGRETLSNLRRLLEAEPVDVVHVLHAYHQMGMNFLGLLNRAQIPTVLSLHDYKIACPNYRLYDESRQRICTICLERPSSRAYAPVHQKCWNASAAAGVALSAEAAMQRMIGTYSRRVGSVVVLNDLQSRCAAAAGVPAGRIFKVPHFVAETPKAPRLNPDAPVLFVGRLVPEKGLDVLLAASAKSGRQVRIVGDGRLRKDMEALAGSIGARAEFLGALGASQVRDEMRKASLLVVPSTWHEVSPLVIIEAMVEGLPVVGTAVGGIPDMLSDGRGFLVPPGDPNALARALEVGPPALAHAAQAAGRWVREELTIDAWLDRMNAAYSRAGTVGKL